MLLQRSRVALQASMRPAAARVGAVAQPRLSFGGAVQARSFGALGLSRPNQSGNQRKQLQTGIPLVWQSSYDRPVNVERDYDWELIPRDPSACRRTSRRI